MSSNNWPKQSGCTRYYGNPSNISGDGFSLAWERANIVIVTCPWVLTDYKNTFKKIRIHSRCAESLSRVLHRVWDACGKSQETINAKGYHVFSGSVVYRKMRKYNRLSTHSYGCAIDWHAPGNMQGDTTPFFKKDELLLQEFRREGWVCGIDWRGADIDAMHVQAAIVG